MMACPKTKRIDEKDWPIYRTSTSGLCVYRVDSRSSQTASRVAAKAAAIDGFVKRSQFYDMPGGRVRVYMYFKA